MKDVSKSSIMEQIEEQKEMLDNDTLRQVFLESYGVEMSFPGYYYSDAKFVPNHNEYIVCTSWHIVPDGRNLEVQTTNINKEYEYTNFDTLYNH